MQKNSERFLRKRWAIEIIPEFLIASMISLRYSNAPFPLPLFWIFVNNSNSTVQIIGFYIGKSGLFLKRFKFVPYLEKTVRKKAQKCEASKQR